jgi:hypothetical protein
MKKFIFSIIAAAGILMGFTSCQMPDYEYKGSSNPEYPDVTVSSYSTTIFSSSLTDVKNPTFAIMAVRDAFGSNGWVTRQCTYETSAPEITVKPYTGSILALREYAMVVNATASGSITVTYPAPVGDKTGTTINVNYNDETGAVVLSSAN